MVAGETSGDLLAGLLLDGFKTRWPSLTSPEDRAALAANPLVTVHGFAGHGHAVGASPAGAERIHRLAHAALLEASRLCV